jgi:hypothetical protein
MTTENTGTPKKSGRPATRGDAKTTTIILDERHRAIAARLAASAGGAEKVRSLATGVRAALDYWDAHHPRPAGEQPQE